METASSSNKLDDHSSQTDDQQYMQASNVNVSNFVSVKLSGHGNYNIWKAQMLCLIKSQSLLYIIKEKHPFPQNKGVHMVKYNKLVIGWIFGSINEIIVEDFLEYRWASTVWCQLKYKFKTAKPFKPERLDYKSNYTSDDTSDSDHTEGTTLELSFKSDSDSENSTRNTKGRLYKAAAEGCWWKAKAILKKGVGSQLAREVITSNGNTILHVAVEKGHNYFVEKLLEFLKDGKDIETKNDDGQTALHIAAVVGNKYAAQLLVQKRKELLGIKDRKFLTPFQITVHSMKLDIAANLLRESLKWQEDIERDLVAIIFNALKSKRYDLALEFLPDDYKNCWFIRDLLNSTNRTLLLVTLTFPSDLGFTESFIYPSFDTVLQKALKTVPRWSLLSNSNVLDTCVEDIAKAANIFNSTGYSRFGKISTILFVPIATLFPIYQLICLLILVLHLTFSMLYHLLWKVLAVTVPPIKNIEKKKKEYQQAKKFLRLIGDNLEKGENYEEEIREAIRLDAYEVVDIILFISPTSINYMDREGHNIIQFAIKNRSEKVYNLLFHIIKRYRRIDDGSRNNLAHLAGRLAPSFVLDRTTGAALQLQRELLWRDEVEKLFSPIDLTNKNVDDETPAMVFSREHKDLMKEGESWMKTTAESCSITAALIVTIVFAAAITVPGGSNQDSGVPVFKKEAAFTVFAVSNAFSLFTSTTSLLLFLSILTARFSEKDFLVSLPRRLIFGLLTLFLSTTAMIVSFCAILFLVFCDQRPWMLAPISAFACLPISVIVTIKLPLLVDFIQSTYFPIFGKKIYLESCKINQNSTFFMDW